MKSNILIAAFLLSSMCLTAQSKSQISDWFYSLPVKKDALKLKKAIQKNTSFQENNKSESGRFSYSSSSYWGIILHPILPKPGQLDSAKISLTIGKLFTKDGYSGGMKWLRFEYFSSDTIFLNGLFDSACIDFKSNAIQEKPTGFRGANSEVKGSGKKYIYINNSSALRSISVERVRYATGIQSFSIHYSESND